MTLGAIFFHRALCARARPLSVTKKPGSDRVNSYTAVKIMVFCEMLVVALFDLDMEL